MDNHLYKKKQYDNYRYTQKKEHVFEETKDLTVSKVFKKLDILPETYLCVREGELITERELLQDGDVIRLIPVISGG